MDAMDANDSLKPTKDVLIATNIWSCLVKLSRVPGMRRLEGCKVHPWPPCTVPRSLSESPIMWSFVVPLQSQATLRSWAGTPAHLSSHVVLLCHSCTERKTQRGLWPGRWKHPGHLFSNSAGWSASSLPLWAPYGAAWLQSLGGGLNQV